MLSANKKISIRQAALVFMTLLYSPTIRIIPTYTASHLKNAAWLAPFLSVTLLYILSLVWHRLYKKYKDNTLIDIYSSICGKVTGKICAAIYLIWIILLTALYLRYFAFRIVSSILPNANINIFYITLLIVVGYSLRTGVETLSRANEIILPILTIIFFLVAFMLLPNVKIDNLYPVTYRDTKHALEAGIGITGILTYFSFLFIIGNRINNKESIKKIGLQISILLLVEIVLLIIITVGTFSYTIVQRTQLPFLTAAKQISLFNTFEKIESIIVFSWVLSDFILICFFVLLALELMKSFIKFEDGKPFINMLLVFIYYLSLYLVNNVFELESLSNNIIIPGNLLLGFILPIIVLAIGKLRKRI